MLLIAVIAVTTLSYSQEKQNNKWTSSRPDGHAPINVMGDHTHKKGEFMFSYRYMSMNMFNNISGDSDISANGVQSKGYKIAPKDMQMYMHMVGVMYAPSNRVTLMVMSSYLKNSMNLNMLMTGKSFSTSSQGFGDTKVMALVNIFNKNHQALHANVGVSLPTGNINKKDVTPMSMSNKTQLAYPMQLGSGTYDVNVGATYLGQNEIFSYGAQAIATFRTGNNNNSYTLGNQLNTVAWFAYPVSKTLSVSTSTSFHIEGKVKGADKNIDMMSTKMMPLFNTANSGRKQVDLGLGLNYMFRKSLHGLRLATEFKLPVYQYANGVQMNRRWQATLGVQYSLGH